MKRRNQSKSAGNTSAAPPQKHRSAGGAYFATPPLQSGGISSTWAVAAALVIIALAAVAVYLNSFAVPFLLDDLVWISKNPSIRHLWPIWQVLYPPHDALVRGRPVVSLTLAINYALGGMNVWGYHVLNLAIHILAAWTLFGVVRRTLMLPRLRERFNSAATPLALVVAILWMLHPLQTESVTYVIQRTEALVGLFYLLTLYCVIRAATSSHASSAKLLSGSQPPACGFAGIANRQESPDTAASTKLWYIAATAACLLGMATKELMVTAPVIVLLYDRTFLAGSFREAWRRRYALYLAMVATWGMVALSVISTGFYGGTAGFAVEKFTWWSYLLTQPSVIAHYLQLAFWPAELCFDYGWSAAHFPSQVLLPGLLLLGLLGLTIWALAKRPAWGFLGAWFFVILTPTSSFVPIKDVIFEHRMYLSLAAVVAAVMIGGWLAGQWLVARRTIRPATLPVLGVSLVAFAAVVLGTLTFQRNADYRTALSIWQDTVAKAPGNARAQTNFGLVLARDGHFDEAIGHYRKALEIEPALAETHYNLGLAFAKSGQLDQAVASFERALKLKPDYADVHNDLGLALLRSGRLDKALVHLRRAVDLNRNDARAQNNLGAALERSGQLGEAIVHFRKALEIEPDFAEARKSLAAALGQEGKAK